MARAPQNPQRVEKPVDGVVVAPPRAVDNGGSPTEDVTATAGACGTLWMTHGHRHRP